jgi:hypothetical protein
VCRYGTLCVCWLMNTIWLESNAKDLKLNLCYLFLEGNILSEFITDQIISSV